MADFVEDVLEQLQIHLAAIQPTLNSAEYAYNHKIARHLLAITQRELAQQRPSSEREAQLVAALRSPSVSWADKALITEIRERAMAKMAIDNPRYSTYCEVRPSR